jgi:hypothetical protein
MYVCPRLPQGGEKNRRGRRRKEDRNGHGTIVIVLFDTYTLPYAVSLLCRTAPVGRRPRLVLARGAAASVSPRPPAPPPARNRSHPTTRSRLSRLTQNRCAGWGECGSSSSLSRGRRGRRRSPSRGRRGRRRWLALAVPPPPSLPTARM